MSIWREYTPLDRTEVLRFLFRNNNEVVPPISSYRSGQEGTLEICISDTGRLFLQFDNDNLVGFFGFLYPEPKTVFVYLCVVDRDYRGGTFSSIAPTVLPIWLKDGIEDVKFSAGENNLQALTAHNTVAKPTSKELDHHGNKLVSFHTPLEFLLNKFNVRKIPPRFQNSDRNA